MIELVVTRHPGMVQFLWEIGLVDQKTEVKEHVKPADIKNKHVCGVLPHSMSCLCKSFTEIPLNTPPDLRGKELTFEQVRKYAGEPSTYTVRKWHYNISCEGKEVSSIGGKA